MEVQPVLQIDDILKGPPGSTDGRLKGQEASLTGGLRVPNHRALDNNSTAGDEQATISGSSSINTTANNCGGGASGGITSSCSEGELFHRAITLVESSEKISAMQAQLGQADAIGFDCEWKPKRERGWEDNEVAVLQIASRSAAFIVDLASLSVDPAAMLQLNSTLEVLFSNPKILKIGVSVGLGSC